MLILFFLLLALLLVLSCRLLYRKYWKKGLRATIGFSSRTSRAGEEAEIVEKTENRKLLPIPLYSHSYSLSRSFNSDVVRHVSTFGLGARSSVVKKTQLSGLKRGIYTLGDGKMEAGDLFSSAVFSSPIHFSSRLVVFPERLGKEEYAFPFRKLLGAVLNNRMSQEDPFEIRGIRPYQSFDPMKTINWKASARTGELMVNQHSYTTDEGVLLVLDVTELGEEEGEWLLSFVSSLAASLLSRGIGVGFLTNGRSCYQGHSLSVSSGSGLGHSDTIDTVLAEIKLSLGAKESIAETLSRLEQDKIKAVPVLVAKTLAPEAGESFPRDGFLLLMEDEGIPGAIRIGGHDEG